MFLGSFSDHYLDEFLEDGGLLVLLEILSQSHIKEEEKVDALRLLLTVSNAGRSYKEVICENHGKYVCAWIVFASPSWSNQLRSS